MRAYISRFAQQSIKRAHFFSNSVKPTQAFASGQVNRWAVNQRRHYGSDHDDHHPTVAAQHPYPKENWNKLWILGSAAVFFPIVNYYYFNQITDFGFASG
jgi:hypothetical protein